MIFQVFAIRDDATGDFSLPFFSRNDDVAHRMMFDVVSNRESLLFSHPEDYHVYRVAVFDDESGVFESLPAPESFSDVAFYRRLVVHADSQRVDSIEDNSHGE